MKKKSTNSYTWVSQRTRVSGIMLARWLLLHDGDEVGLVWQPTGIQYGDEWVGEVRMPPLRWKLAGAEEAFAESATLAEAKTALIEALERVSA